MALIPGTRLGSYEVLALLGAGGMGEVYRARDSQLGRDVAIKVLANLSSDPDRLRRFEQEARAAAALNHPNILAVHQLGTHEGAPYLVSELLEGETLREQLRRGHLPVRKAIDYGVQITRGLAAAHEKGIIHRDLKPENLFISRDGRLKILDFGLAKLTQPRQTSEFSASTLIEGTEPGLVLGTVGYMSPEQVRGQTSDHRADIFAFGAILYEMLAGNRAFQKPTSAETMTAILNEDPPAISQVTPNLPPALQRVVHRCLEKDPERRFQSASDLAFALEALSDSGILSSGSAAAPQKFPIKPRWIAALGVAVIAVLLVTWWRSPAVAPQIESVVQLTHDGEPKPVPASMASDGSRLYFQEWREGVLTIAEVSVAGGETLPLTTGLVNPRVLDISPDVAALLVSSGMSFDDASLAALPLPAGQPRKLANAYGATFFPDGQQIVYCSGATVSIARKDGSNARKIAEVPGSADSPAISPDGRRIRLTVRDTGGNNSLWEVHTDGTRLHALLPNRRRLPSEFSGKWSADGRFFIFERFQQEEGRTDLWAIPEKHGILSRSPAEPIRLTNGPLSYDAPLPSRDGKKIFAIGYQNRGELIRYDRGSKQFLPALGGISVTDVMYSSDGQWMVYLSYPDHTLWRSRADGSERLQLTYPPMQVFFPHISADGKQVAFTAGQEGEAAKIYSMSMQGGDAKYLADGWGPSWSPDGALLVFQAFSPDKKSGDPEFSHLVTLDLASGKFSTIPDSQPMDGPYWPSPDMIVAGGAHNKLYSYDRTAQKWSELADGPIQAWITSPDSKYLYLTRETPDNPEAMRVRLADRKIEPVVSLKGLRRVSDPVVGGNSWIGVAPDGSLLLSRGAGTQEVFALTVKWP